MSERLSEKWETVPLGDVADYINGRAFKPEDWGDSGLPIIRIQNLTDPNAPFNYYEGDVLDRYYVNSGDLLISWSASLDAFIWDRGPAILNQHIFRVVEDPTTVDRWYLYYAVKSIIDMIRERTHGATMKHIRKGEFEAMRIPLPPLDEQRRIAAIIDEQMAAVEEARAAAEAQLRASEELAAAYLREVFEKESDSWPVQTLEEVCTLPPAKSISTNGEIEVQAITTACLTETGFDPAGLKSARMRIHDVKDAMVSRGEILVARSNTVELVGRVSIYPGYGEDVVASDLTYRIIPTVGLLPEFLSAFLSYLFVTGYWREKAGGTSPSMKKITKSQLRALEVPIPDLSNQEQTVRVVSTILNATNDAQRTLREQLQLIAALPSVLLRQAFSGEL